MLLTANVTYSNFVRSLYPELYSDDETLNRVLAVDDLQRAAQIALSERVIQLYPPNLVSSGNFNTFRCAFDCASPSFDDSMRMAEVALLTLQPDSRNPSLITNPRTEFVPGTGHGRIRILFDLKQKLS